jgi:uncharacterized protein YlaI
MGIGLCNICQVRVAVKTFDGESLCQSCTVDRLIETVERLMTGYISVNAEIVYEEDRD